jgi:ArsR family transcriptional regulator
MLNLLARNPELCVCDMQSNFDLAQPTISHHLGILKKAGLVDCDVRGRWCFYRANTQAISELATVLEVDR